MEAPVSNKKLVLCTKDFDLNSKLRDKHGSNITSLYGVFGGVGEDNLEAGLEFG